ncbi:MAG: VWA domain-containing protein, partial [Alphaproteobacteria bacterium]|nr:VWA domain-containing protein [Alphaproteobacteria bacterium]
FTRLDHSPVFIKNPKSELLSVYKIGRYLLSVSAAYEIFSAAAHERGIFMLARDRNGNFVHLGPQHFALYSENGNKIDAQIITNPKKGISILIDRSGSMDGFDDDVVSAIKEFGKLPVVRNLCGLYEFSSSVRVVQRPMKVQCRIVLDKYRLATAGGGTALFEAMEKSYRDGMTRENISVVLIVSDGRPSDSPGPSLKRFSERIPTFVLWVGNHVQDYISEYSTSHAIANSGVHGVLKDFFNSIAFSVHSHQVLIIKN